MSQIDSREHNVICGECGSPMVLHRKSQFKDRHGNDKPWYGCSQFPKCRGTHGAHPDGRPCVTPAVRETKQLRIAAHDAFDRLWKRELGGWMSRGKAYSVMRDLMVMSKDEAHIANFDRQQCEELIERLAKLGISAATAGGVA